MKVFICSCVCIKKSVYVYVCVCTTDQLAICFTTFLQIIKKGSLNKLYTLQKRVIAAFRLDKTF